MVRALPLLLLVACSGGEAPPAAPAAPTEAVAPAEVPPAEAAPAAQWACPMHPEVTGAEGDTCSKCGMALEQLSAKPEGGHEAHGAEPH